MYDAWRVGEASGPPRMEERRCDGTTTRYSDVRYPLTKINDLRVIFIPHDVLYGGTRYEDGATTTQADTRRDTWLVVVCCAGPRKRDFAAHAREPNTRNSLDHGLIMDAV